MRYIGELGKEAALFVTLEQVLAIQITGENIPGILRSGASVVFERLSKAPGTVKLRVSLGTRSGWEGDWIVQVAKGEFDILDNDTFRARYRPARGDEIRRDEN